jgi:YVTN family beta-propeller protein
MPVSARLGRGRTNVLALSMATVCVIAAACVGTSSDPSSSTASAVPSGSPGVPGPSPTEAGPPFTQIELPDLGGGMVVAGGALWDATDSGAVRVDTAAGTVSELIPGVTNLAFDGERLWAGGEKLLLELDPRSGEVLQRFAPDYSAFYLAASPDAIWATDTSRGLVRRIDPSDGHVVATIKVPLVPKGTRLGEGALWIACDAAATVVRINTSTNEIEAEIAVGKGPHTIATGGGAVWVTNRHSSTLSKIDPTTNQVVATVEDVATSPNVGVAVGPQSVYVGYAGGLALVDPDLAAITKRIDVAGIGFYDLRIMDDVLWASNFSRANLYGFDLQVLSVFQVVSD